MEAASGLDIDVQDDGQTVSGVDEQGVAFSASQGSAARLPPGFPADLLVPDDLVFESSTAMGTTLIIAGTFRGELKAAADGVADHMTSKGWTSAISINEPETSIQMWQQGERSANYTISEAGEGELNLVISTGVDEAGDDAGGSG